MRSANARKSGIAKVRWLDHLASHLVILSRFCGASPTDSQSCIQIKIISVNC